ncbi:MAG: hypothetical protein ACYDA8_08550 [Deferrisomatales bacterium]
MPLAFPSLSHGIVAFGFYNIETDGLLLDRLFFFCTDFCRAAVALEQSLAGPTPRAELPAYAFDDPSRIGDLMGAIHGTRLTGFLGETYRRWPFPADPAGFRQKLAGHANRAEAEAILARWARPAVIPMVVDPATREHRIGPYAFSEAGYRDLLAYVWRGGHPTWEGYEQGRRPPWVAELARATRQA